MTFCASEDWGLWEDGDVVKCFQNIVLLNVASLVLILGILARLFQLLRVGKPLGAQPTALASTHLQIVLTFGLLITFAALSITNATEGRSAVEHLLPGIVLAVSLAFSIAPLWQEQRLGLSSNAYLRVGWILLFLVGCVRFRTDIRDLRNGDASWSYEIVMRMVAFLLALLLALSAVFQRRVSVRLHYGHLPMEEALLDEKEQPYVHKPLSPEHFANWFSVLTFGWISPIMALGRKRVLEHGDLFEIEEEDSAENVGDKLEAAWMVEMKNKTNPSLLKVLFRVFGRFFSFLAFPKLINDIFNFTGPILLKLVVTFIQDHDQPMYYGYILAALMFLGSTTQSLALGQYFFMGWRLGMRMRAGLCTLVYRKSFRVAVEQRQEFTTGEITNLMSIDASRIGDVVSYFHLIWSAPLQLIISIVLLYQEVGYAVFGGLSLMIILMPINQAVVRKQLKLNMSILKKKDGRVKAINEALQGIKILKFFAWEGSFIQRIFDLRLDEVRNMKKNAFIAALASLLWMGSPAYVGVTHYTVQLTFVIYSTTGHTLTASKAFTSLALFNIMSFPLAAFPLMLNWSIEAWTSIKRLNKYMVTKELDSATFYESCSKDERDGSAYSVEVEDGAFQWGEAQSNRTITDICVKVPHHTLVMLAGPVGSGKSTFLRSILGDTVKVSGSVSLHGRVAYCSQQAWIQNTTLRDNILFGSPFDPVKYKVALHACALQPDIDMLPSGDLTEIGERGINLSGGQKQRVSLARAVYADADLYMLDDPLSAVDPHVGKHIFEECIQGALRRKTVLLVTHQVQYLPLADHVLIFQKGRIILSGSFEELTQSGYDISHLVDIQESKTHEEEEGKQESREGTTPQGGNVEKPVSTKEPLSEKEDKGKLVQKEERETGYVDARVWMTYIRASGGTGVASLVLGAFILSQGTSIAQNWWLSHWSSGDSSGGLTFNLTVYVGLATAFVGFVYLRSLSVAITSVRAGAVLHNRLLDRILRAPMAFFDTTPVGRVLNRFSSDLYTIDDSLRPSLSSTMSNFLLTIGILGVISVVSPYFTFAIVPLAALYYYCQKYYRSSSREIKRLDSLSKSPIYAHFAETLNGTFTIRAYDHQRRFTAENEAKINRNLRAYWASGISNRWLAIRLEFMGNIVVALAALFAIVEDQSGDIEPGMVGLSLSYALQITNALNWLIRSFTQLETQMISVERVGQYCRVEQEAASIIESRRPPPTWPESGKIELENLSFRYRPLLDPVLRGVSCTINGREKVGVVGRTGAGKSSLMLAIFRLAEPDPGSHIRIDGLECTELGLSDLRSRLAIIPQDPVLFTGTIRSNLDPFHEYSDDELWGVLERVHLKDVVENADDKLDAPVSENGENLSVGQRQLLCMGRAMLKRTRVLIMDEATASVDMETDALIQETIRKEFADRTVLTIAHRLNTVLDYDRIMVLDKGQIAEMAAPKTLLEDPDSQFYAMMGVQSSLFTSRSRDHLPDPLPQSLKDA